MSSMLSKDAPKTKSEYALYKKGAVGIIDTMKRTAMQVVIDAM